MDVIGAAVLRKKIGANTRNLWISDPSIKYLGVWDEFLLVPTRAQLEDCARFASSVMDVAGLREASEGFDCEDFAFAFMGLARLRAARKGAKNSVAVGVAYGVFGWRPRQAHCCNWTLIDNEDGTHSLAWLEPQDLLAGNGALPTPRLFSDGGFEMLKIMIA